MFELCKQFSFVNDRIHGLFVYNSNFRHFLHSVHSFELFPLDLPYFSEAPFAHDAVELEVSSVDAYEL